MYSAGRCVGVLVQGGVWVYGVGRCGVGMYGVGMSVGIYVGRSVGVECGVGMWCREEWVYTVGRSVGV